MLVLSSWLLLGRPAVNASESNCAHFLDARLELFWALWVMVRAECDVAPVQTTTRRTDKQQMQSRVRKVATSARTGEKGRALAAARNAPPVPVTEQIVQEIKSLYPADPEPPAPVQAPVSALFLSTTLRKMPRPSEPGPLGMRAEHWYEFGSLAGNSDLFVQVIAHIAAAAVPNPVLQYLKAGQITPLAKPTGGHRPLLMMSFLRRLALKSVMAAKKESVAKCAGPLQHGVGRPDGANTMIETIQYLAEADNSWVLVALDLKAAFQNVSRRALLYSIAQSDTDLAAVFSKWYTSTTVHRMHYDSGYTKISANSGWIRVVLCQRVDSQPLCTLYFDQLWHSSAHFTIRVPNSSPTWTTGICGSNRSVYYRQSLTVNDLRTIYVGAASQHVLRMCFVPGQEAHNFDRQVMTLWSRLMHRDIASPLFSTPQAWWTWGGLCGSTSCGCPLARVAVNYSHVDGNNPISGYRLTLQFNATTGSSTRSTPIHPLPTNEKKPHSNSNHLEQPSA